MPVKWIYANGSTWITFDDATQIQIEALWSRHAASWIQTNMFRGPVYIDMTEMVLITDGCLFAIARITN
ncbi:hypothetical protein G6F56_013113 [Rhizopus delemar]|nr:hypothetical protein G6F56_013113 [Rhizopus delemar]